MSGEPDDAPASNRDSLLALLRSITASLGQEPREGRVTPAYIRSALDQVEASTPGGVPLHTQLDTVRKWLTTFERPGDHERFGGIDHLRQHVLLQVRLAERALEDYQRHAPPGSRPEP
jgi:hypothetical protein